MSSWFTNDISISSWKQDKYDQCVNIYQKPEQMLEQNGVKKVYSHFKKQDI